MDKAAIASPLISLIGLLSAASGKMLINGAVHNIFWRFDYRLGGKKLFLSTPFVTEGESI